MARIPEDKIDEIRTAADIVEVLSDYLSLKRRGRNYLAICPFHTEKTPSFSVSPDKQIFHCFGCGKGGNVFSFLMEHEKMTFIEAVTTLAHRYGIALPRYDSDRDSRTERMIFANEIAADFFHKNLSSQKYRAKLEPYLYNQRGLTPETVEKFRIGISPDEWTALVAYAAKKDIKPEELAAAGLAYKSDKTGDYIDRFRLRLMFPIHNISGKVVGFGGRALRKGERAKYVNSPETPVYNKSFILYGLSYARNAIRESGSVVIVEGYFDFLSLFQAGLENVVAVSGTAFTPQQARMLGRFAQKAYLLFDSDSAGRSAAIRSVENFYNVGIEPVIATVPPGHDPDTYVREFGKEGIEKILADGVGYLNFRFRPFDMNNLTMREKETVTKEVKALAAKIDDSLKREIFVAQASEILNLPAHVLKPGEKVETVRDTPERVRNRNLLEMEFLSLFMVDPHLLESVSRDIAPEDLQGPGHGELLALMLDAVAKTGEINPDKLIENVKDEQLASALAYISTLEWGDINISGVVKEYTQMILNQKRDRQLARLREELEKAKKSGDTRREKAVYREIQYLLEKRR